MVVYLYYFVIAYLILRTTVSINYYIKSTFNTLKQKLFKSNFFNGGALYSKGASQG